MTFTTLPAIAAALFFLAPCPVFAEEDAEAAYAKFHRAMLTGNFNEIKKYAPPKELDELEKMSADQRQGMLELAKALMPKSYTITGRQPGADGNQVTLRATAMGVNLFGDKPEPMVGEIRMLKQGGEWKVQGSKWENAKANAGAPQRAADAPPAPKAAAKSAPKSQPAPAAGTMSKTPERKLGAAKEPCVYKPVMTNEDLERCR